MTTRIATHSGSFHADDVFGEDIPAMGTPLYTDVRLYGEAGVPGVIYGAGPRTVLESHAKRADERLELEDLRRATKVVARTLYEGITSRVEGITHPYLNVGHIEGGTNTNVVPGRVVFKLDRRMIPEEDPTRVEAALRELIEQAAAARPGIRVDVRRILLARALQPLPGNAALVAALQRHGEAVIGEAIPVSGTPLYTDVRLYGEAGIPAAIYGAGPRSVLESNAKRADEHLVLEDLRRATRVVARTLFDLLAPKAVA